MIKNPRIFVALALLLAAGCSAPFVGTHAITQLASDEVDRPAPRAEFGKPFLVFDGTLLTGKPRDGIPATLRIRVVYDYQHDGDGLWRDGGERSRVAQLPPAERAKAMPPRQQVERVAKLARDSLFCPDIEANWTYTDDRAVNVERNADACRGAAQVARWARAANPYVRIGLFDVSSPFVNAAAGTDDGREEDYWRNFLELVAPHVDYLAPAFYVMADTDMPTWRVWVDYRVPRLREARKPIYAFINIDGPPEKVSEALRVLRGRVDGLILWSNPGKYDKRAAWVEMLN